WFKHISDVAEQYKPKSKNNANEPLEDIGSTTLPHSNTKESLESTPERTNSNASSYSHNKSSTNIPDDQDVNDMPPPLPLPQKNTVDRSEVLLRSASKKSSDNDYVNSSLLDDASGNQSKRDSNSHICSNNSNETITLMQDNQLQDPTAVQISISSVHTAEPILTQSERLRRLDIRIKDNLSEKLTVIADMFRIPVEHFHEIVDIVEQPEAPKDCSDIILQPSGSLCDKCHDKQLPSDKSTSVISSKLSKQPAIADSTNVTVVVGVENRNPEPPINCEIYQEDDDGYCELAEVRPAAVQKQTSISESGSGSSTASTSHSQSTGSPPELLKRQSLISVDSIPEESENEVQETEGLESECLVESNNVEKIKCHTAITDNVEIGSSATLVCSSSSSKQILCGPSRLIQPGAANIELSIPLSKICTSIHTLNTYISQLMPKINERDAEREQLKRENQHLREMLSALHERLRSSEDSVSTF
uniref:Uncharacterized protein n=1 Tax=Megaselia scalaris TaxID=36166 RepID=T1GG77_MEGSC